MACCAVVQKADKAEKANRTTTVRPRVDILETGQEFLLVADLPGVNPNDVDLQFDKGELTVRGSRSGPRNLAFERTFTVSDAVAADRIGAELKNGVLTVKLPKVEAVKPRKIAVHA
jgi:HSP20 family protein